jgi:hypothetical protein
VRNNPTNITDPSGQNWFVDFLVGFFKLLLNMFTGGKFGSIVSMPGAGTPPFIDSGPLSNTGAMLNSIYNPKDLSKYATPPFFEPGSDYYDPSMDNPGSTDPGDPGNDPQKLFLKAMSDCNAGFGREITYVLKGVDTAGNIIDAKNYTVQEHIKFVEVLLC